MRQYTLSRSLDDAIRQLKDARRTAANRRAAAAGETAATLDRLIASLDEAYAPLPELFSTIQAADLKPTAATDAAATTAIERVQAALALFNEAMRQ